VNNDAIGLIFSGDHYSISNPLLHYTRNLLFENNIDYLGFNFLYSANTKYLTGNIDYKRSINFDDTEITFEIFRNLFDKYKKVFLISKSSGLKHILNILLNTNNIAKLIIIIFTPAFEWFDYIEHMSNSEIRQLVFTGTKDNLFAATNLQKIVQNQNVRIVQITDADHSLEVDNIKIDLQNLTNVIETTNHFIKSNLKNIS
jgi:hypothetical protein